MKNCFLFLFLFISFSSSSFANDIGGIQISEFESLSNFKSKNPKVNCFEEKHIVCRMLDYNESIYTVVYYFFNKSLRENKSQELIEFEKNNLGKLFMVTIAFKDSKNILSWKDSIGKKTKNPVEEKIYYKILSNGSKIYRYEIRSKYLEGEIIIDADGPSFATKEPTMFTTNHLTYQTQLNDEHEKVLSRSDDMENEKKKSQQSKSIKL